MKLTIIQPVEQSYKTQNNLRKKGQICPCAECFENTKLPCGDKCIYERSK